MGVPERELLSNEPKALNPCVTVAGLLLHGKCIVIIVVLLHADLSTVYFLPPLGWAWFETLEQRGANTPGPLFGTCIDASLISRAPLDLLPSGPVFGSSSRAFCFFTCDAESPSQFLGLCVFLLEKQGAGAGKEVSTSLVAS